MVPKAGLEPARISPHAPQTCASTNSATWAGFKERLLRLVRSRCCGCSRCRCSRRRCCRCRCSRCRCCRGRRTAHHGSLRPALKDGEGHGRDDECDEEPGRQLVQERRRAARAEGSLRSATTEGARQIRTLALLDEDDQNQKQADDDMKNYKQNGHELFSNAPQRGRDANSSREGSPRQAFIAGRSESPETCGNRGLRPPRGTRRSSRG
jgi:hypothetical protein